MYAVLFLSNFSFILLRLKRSNFDCHVYAMLGQIICVNSALSTVVGKQQSLHYFMSVTFSKVTTTRNKFFTTLLTRFFLSKHQPSPASPLTGILRESRRRRRYG